MAEKEAFHFYHRLVNARLFRSDIDSTTDECQKNRVLNVASRNSKVKSARTANLLCFLLFFCDFSIIRTLCASCASYPTNLYLRNKLIHNKAKKLKTTLFSYLPNNSLILRLSSG